MSWIIRKGNGIELPQIGWNLDPQRPAAQAIVSHAHFDHLAASKAVLCSEATGHFMRKRLPRKRSETRLAFGAVHELTPECSLTLLPAGHILGSSLMLLQHREHGSLLYTGDFKLRHGSIAEPCACPKADVLIMESTFGLSHYAMPPTAEVVAQLSAYCLSCIEQGHTPVVMAYSLGKAQEVLALLGSTGARLLVHPSIAEMNRVHDELGVRLPTWQEFDESLLPGSLVIAPPLSRNAGFLKRIPSAKTILASGWALDRSTIYRQKCDAAFPLSDHADYPDLLAFAKLVNPSKILTVHGFAKELASTLRTLGFDALALGQANQLDLSLGC